MISFSLDVSSRALGDTAQKLSQPAISACIHAEDYVAHMTNGIYLADGRPAITGEYMCSPVSYTDD